MKLIKKLVTGLMILLVALGSSPLEVFALPDNERTEWPTDGTNGVKTTLPQPPAVKNIVDLSSMFHYPTLDYTGLNADNPGELGAIKKLKGYVTNDDRSVAVITRDAPWQAGVMWSDDKDKDNKINLAEPFHMVSYVYLGIRGQTERTANDNRGGADGITFTIHNDNKSPVDASMSGSTTNTGKEAYGALGNGLGVYGNNFSANTGSATNNMAYMTKGVTNGIALEFDTFYNDEKNLNGKQFTDTDLWHYIESGGLLITEDGKSVRQGAPNTKYGHIAINYLNQMQGNIANSDGPPFNEVPKHAKMLSVGWDGEISEDYFDNEEIPGLHYVNGWQVSTLDETKPKTQLADNKWHRLEVTWEPTTSTTGKLTYKIYRQGYDGPTGTLTSIAPTKFDGNSYIYKDVYINVSEVFRVDNINNSVYWGFTGSTGYYQNNQAVQMLQLPEAYYQSEILKKDQDENLVSGAVFELEKWNETTGYWDVQEFYNPKNGQSVRRLMTGSQQDMEIGVYSGVFQSLGKIKLTQLTKGTYRWKEVAPPEGYQLDKVYYEGYQRDKIYYPEEKGFVVNYANSKLKNAFQYEAKNTKLSQIELNKKDKDTGDLLNGVKFTIFKELGGVTSYLKAKSGNTDFEWTPNENDAKQFVTGYSYYVRNGKIEESELAETDKGYIRIGYIENGANLSWKEVKESVPKGYDSSGELTGKFEKSTKDNGYVYSGEQTNSRLYQVSLVKTASDTKEGLQDALFALQRKDGDPWVDVTYDGKSEFNTNSEGKISIPNLEAGTYRWEEKKAPTGYKRDKQYYPKEEGFEVAYHDGLATDPSNQNYLFEAIPATNSPRKFELVLQKLSSTFNRPIGEVEFTLYSNFNGTTFSDSDKISARKTNSEGEIDFGNDLINADKTAEKTYYLVETKAADGFIALNGYFKVVASKTEGIHVSYVSYKSDGGTNESPVFNLRSTSTETDVIYSGLLTIYNKRRESILPTTGGNGILGYVGIGLTMTIVALLFFIARKRIFKWLIILIVATSGLAGLAGGTQVVSAQEQEQVQLEVNRLVYQPSDTQYKSGVPVAGAKLEVVDVTKSFYELVNRQKLSLKEAQEAVSKSNKIDGQSLAVATTDQSGLVRFTVSKTSQQRPAVYLIRELVTPVAVTKMENMVVVLPILDESGNEKSVIPLHPKSHGTFTFDKTIDEKQSSYSFGEPISYRLSTIIPQDMPNLSSYEIEDIYDQGLRFISESLEIFIDGEKQSDSTKAVSLSENQFRVVFDVAKLADFSGKKLEVTYQMVIKDEAAIDQDLVNTATLYPGDLTPLVDRENVRTGGFRFIKRAAEGKQNPLAKATFVIKNPTDDTVLTYKEGKYQFEKVATNASGVVRLTSDDDGYFEIRGLRYGEYLVSEIRAPSGYVLNDKPTAFTVGVSTYSQGPVLSIFNVKKPKIRLPETGTVATSTAFVGLLIMASSLVMIRRRKDN
ncbi:TPA: SpaH/EbpB family LPXTG-anchored major pilin [Streptococcus suis]